MWKLVTELEIRRLAWGFLRPEAAASIESWCAEGAGVRDYCLNDCERRRRNPTGRLATALCKRFGVSSVSLLGLGRQQEAARWWTWMTPDEKDFLVNRRTVLKGATAGLLLPVSDLVSSAQVIGRRKGYVVGDGDVDFAQATATDLAIAYAADPGVDAVRATRSHALTLLDLLKSSNATIKRLATRTRLQTVASDACALAGYAEMNAGRLDAADLWFRSAMALAWEAGDRRLEGLALVGRAWIPLLQPEPDRAAALAALQGAASFASVLRPAGRAYVFGYLATLSAAVGEDLSSGRFLHEAHTAAALMPYDAPGWGWWSAQGEFAGWDGAVRPKVYTGSRLVSLGRPAEALELFQAAMDGTTRPVRRARLYQDVMDACVGLDDPDQACGAAMAALDEGQRHDVRYIFGEVRKSRAAFPDTWRGLSPVESLDERLCLVC